MGQTFFVDLGEFQLFAVEDSATQIWVTAAFFPGSTVAVDCKAATYSDSDDLFWLIEDAFADTNESLPIYYNHTR